MEPVVRKKWEHVASFWIDATCLLNSTCQPHKLHYVWRLRQTILSLTCNGSYPYDGKIRLNAKSASAWIEHPSRPACPPHCHLISRKITKLWEYFRIHLPSSSLSLCSARSTLGLLCLLRTLRSCLLLLRLFGSLRASGCASFRTLGAALLDHVERGTNHSTLGLDLTTTAGLGLLLEWSSDVKHCQSTMWCCIPLRCPFFSVSGTGRSRRCGAGSCAAGRGTRSCHSGNGRHC